MHLHAYCKANYQTNIQIPYAILHKLQIISGTSVQFRIEKQSFGEEMRNRTRVEQENMLQHVVLSVEPFIGEHT